MRSTSLRRRVARAGVLFLASLAPGCASAPAKIAYDQYVWPPPPDLPRIQLEDVVLGRADTQAKSRFQRALLGSSPQGPFDWFKRPFAVAYDAQGRLLVTDSGLGALFRFDRAARKADVLGTAGAVALRTPLGLDVARDGRIYVADVGIRKVVAFDPDGKVRAVYGREGELQNPTDAAVSPDGRSLYVADSKAHRVAVFDIATARQLRTIGRRGQGDGEFNFPSAVAFDSSGNLLVVDQVNARVQVLTEEGGFLDQLGGLGVGYANFVRPKDVAVDEAGLVYVTDAAFGNVQIFDADLQLLTFVGSGGEGPGQFQIASGVAVHGDRFAMVDQLGRRVQLFRYLVPKTAPSPKPTTTAAMPAPPRAAAPVATPVATPAATPQRPREAEASAKAPPAARAPGPAAPPASSIPPASSAPPARPVPPSPPRAPGPAVPAARVPGVPILTAVSPSQVRAPGTFDLEVRGSGLRPDLQARVTRGGVGVTGVTLERQRFMDSTSFRVTIRIERRVSPGACDLGFDDPRGGNIAPLRLTVAW